MKNKEKTPTGKTVTKQAKTIRKIKTTPKVGNISREAARKAAKTVLGKK